MALVTVLTATYNRALVLPEAIRSVLEQDFDDWEYFILDDGSTDNTQETVRPFLVDKRIRYFALAHAGQTAALNVGIEKAESEFIAFLDSDDKLFPNHLSYCLTAIQKNPKLDFVLGRFKLELKNPEKKFFVDDFYRPGKKLPLEKITVATGLFFGKRERFLGAGGFQKNRFLDIGLFDRMQKKGFCWKRLQKPTYLYRHDLCK